MGLRSASRGLVTRAKATWSTRNVSRRTRTIGTRARAVVCAARKEIISTDAAPGAVGPYSQAIKSGNMLFVSGCIPLVPGTTEFNSEAVEEQTDQALKNMGEILKAGGCSFDDVVKTTVLLADIKDFAAVNGVYAKYFPSNPPARSAFAVRELPLGAKVEIECIAAVA
ncbi:putative reactive intermediate/imine deaminase [Chloropicon primus]|uniref:Putative reactive intermediate/imine deaminase n=2 Tax=Chloropicon primus TaxID=1764295 RepID=A0A5B8MEA2_9CHLO|nr:putative reactive intermediate/imine deaminase [Chloropicon primus]UPQ98156.1 putative reactive intermediate/imine deaminase [Chloropicon primus]|eukprot:QDZ18948.1 putative reactive intermediate/imine deaminase [Chloropicon primus]